VKEIRALIDRARKYLRSAEVLISIEDFESSVSRAYYAMFFTVQAALLTQGVAASTHKGLIAAFGERFIKTGIFPKELGREIGLAFEKRQLGDYEYALVIERAEAVAILESARRFVAEIEKWLAAAKADLNGAK
jgi:uncharacterized protein (UPF0332 family)